MLSNYQLNLFLSQPTFIENNVKILQVYRHSARTEIGGVLKFMTSLAKELSKIGVASTLIGVCRDSIKHPIYQDGYEICEYEKSFSALGTPLSFKLLRQLNAISKKYDIIHFHSPCLLSLLASFLIKDKPYIVTYHADITTLPFVYMFYKFFERLFLKRASAIIVTSPQYLETSAPLKKFKDKTRVITIGVEFQNTVIKDFNVLPKNSDLQLPENFFLFLGANRNYKGLDTIANVALKLPQVNFVMAGPRTADVKSGSVKTKNLITLGEVTDSQKLQLLKTCHCVMLPSNNRAEALGISLIEGAMFSKPLISCEIGSGTSFVNVDGETGLVVKPNSTEELKDAVLKLYKNTKLKEELGSNAFRRFQSHFRIEKMAQDYLVLLKTISKEKISDIDNSHHPDKIL